MDVRILIERPLQPQAKIPITLKKTPPPAREVKQSGCCLLLHSSQAKNDSYGLK